MKPEPKISVAICTYNREKYLPQLFASILSQSLERSSFEVLLINNNSPGNTQELFAKFSSKNPDIIGRYFLETQQGLSFSRNRALHESNAPCITFLDDDAFIDSNYLKEVLNSFDSYPNVGAIGGPIFLNYESIVPSWENKYLNSLLGYFNKGEELHYFTKSDYPRGSNMSFRTILFEKTGMFDVQLGRIGKNLLGGEEKDLFNRIYDAKIEVLYQPKCIVHHSVPIERTTKQFIKQQALGTGKSEQLRAKTQGIMNYLKRIGLEWIKWNASFLLWFVYLLKFQPSKGNMIVFFRYWVTKGLVFKYEES